MILQVFLLLILQNSAAEEIIDCVVNKRFRVTRDNDVYKLRLCNSTNHCTMERSFIKSDDQYDFCKSIPGIQDCQNTSCEDSINSFLNDSCKLNDAFDQQITCTSSIQCVAPTPCTIVTKETPGMEPSPRNNQALDSTRCTQVLVPVLGVMTGLFLVILALVITGWVWTYRTLKKQKKRAQLCTKCQDRESEEERFCPNQLYEMTTTEPVVGTAIEQLLDSLEESGQSNIGLSSKDNKGYRDVKRVENIYTSSEGSTQSSLQEEQAVNRVEEGESGEKHVYHVLEKPGGDDYEDPDKDLEEDTIMEYETPVPLN